MRKQGVLFWIVIAFALLGIINGLFGRGPLELATIIIPLIIVGVVFLLYKFPPRKYRRQKAPKIKPSARTMAKVAAERRTASGAKRKSYPFRVIEGQKGKNEDDLPKYH
ncbi:hypothetical protein V3851_01410 [Paenibacillus sp. M1]|uniref:DUF2207 domain-containing protein n=1 Tax=Paenibacillus haidiansis TaxID=1574488 RepID=A0ABU7VMF5_9BACL